MFFVMCVCSGTCVDANPLDDGVDTDPLDDGAANSFGFPILSLLAAVVVCSKLLQF